MHNLTKITPISFRNRHLAMECTKWKRKNALRKHGDIKYYLHFIPPTKRYLPVSPTEYIAFSFSSFSICMAFFVLFFFCKIQNENPAEIGSALAALHVLQLLTTICRFQSVLLSYTTLWSHCNSKNDCSVLSIAPQCGHFTYNSLCVSEFHWRKKTVFERKMFTYDWIFNIPFEKQFKKKTKLTLTNANNWISSLHFHFIFTFAEFFHSFLNK